MPARRRRRPGSDRLYVTTDSGLPLGHLDLVERTAHDVPTGWRDQFLQEANAWLWTNNLPTLGPPEEPEPAAVGAGVDPPEGGWTPGWADLALHHPGHGLAEEAFRARSESGRDADRAVRLRADGQEAVAQAMGKLVGAGRRRARVRPSSARRWRMLHAVPMTDRDSDEVLLDHVVLGPSGVFVVEVQNHPGGRVVAGPQSLEIDKEKIDLGRRRRIGEEAARRLSAGLALAAGATETLNPPPVTPVVAVVGAIVVGGDRPRGVLVSRAGHLPRLLNAFSPVLVDEAVEQTYAVARRSDTWTR